MRCTQIVGLKPEVKTWLEKKCKYETKIKVCPHCGGQINVVKTVLSSVYDNSGRSGMFGDGPHLREYQLENGEFIREVVQCAPWSSGPCIFLCLEYLEGDRLFEWTEKEIEQQI